MTEEIRWYMGFLGNVDSSILDVQLNDEYCIEKMTTKEYIDFILKYKKFEL